MSIFGIVLFFIFGGMAFWLLVFLMAFVVPYWVTLGAMEQLRPKRVFEEKED